MTTILGIGNPVHDTGAAIIEDGTILAAINEERLSREKRELRFPSSAVNALIEEVDSIDSIAISAVGNRTFSVTAQIKRKQSTGFRSLTDGVVRSIYNSIGDDEQQIIDEVARKLADETDLNAHPDKLAAISEYVNHHRAHAASAYFTSGFDNATIVTIDSAGDGLSSTAWSGQNGEIKRVAKNDMVDSLGVIWTLMPTVFGFKGAKHAGKFMGMAPYCTEVPAKLEKKLHDIVQVDGFDIINKFSRQHGTKTHEQRVVELKNKFGQFEAPEVARALQERTEDILTEMVKTAISKTGYKNVALAGGVVANVKVNQRIYELDDVDKIFIHQNMGDGGLGVGAALDLWSNKEPSFRPKLLEDVYLGPSFTDEEIRTDIDRTDIPEEYHVEFYDSRDLIAEQAADMLAEGEVIHIFTGGMEYGPRALGNRSILYQPTDQTAIKWLNDHLDRTEFMPFAPVTLSDYATDCYIGYDSELCPAAEFMTITFDCTEEMKERSPGAVHIDGTARPQIIRKEVNPFYYDMIDKYRERTGIPTLINTSFNMHGEPIVCKPIEAVRSFINCDTKALVLENTMITKGEEE